MKWYEYDFSRSPVREVEVTIQQVGTWMPDILAAGIQQWLDNFQPYYQYFEAIR